jgi:hypothetical protein
MDITWRTIQFFMVEDGHRKEFEDTFIAEEVYTCEVQTDVDNPSKLRCNCRVFNDKGRCNHIRFVKERSKLHEGEYVIRVAQNADEDDALELLDTPEGFREFLLRYGKPEVT